MEAAMRLVATWKDAKTQEWVSANVTKGVPQTIEDAAKLLVDKTQAYLDAKRVQTRNHPSLRRQSRLGFANALLEVATGAKEDVKTIAPKQAAANIDAPAKEDPKVNNPVLQKEDALIMSMIFG